VLFNEVVDCLVSGVELKQLSSYVFIGDSSTFLNSLDDLLCYLEYWVIITDIFVLANSIIS
jgi:hypothetical protein